MTSSASAMPPATSGAEYADRKSGLPHDAPTAAEMLDFARNSAADTARLRAWRQ
jgi:hypothetical protein